MTSEYSAVRGDWEQGIVRQRRGHGTEAAPIELEGDKCLPAPADARAEPGAGHIRLSWDPVPGAAGYVIERTGGTDDVAPHILRHGGSDVAAVVGPMFADTGLPDGEDYQYRIGAVAGAEDPVRSWSAPVRSRTSGVAPDVVTINVDASAERGQLQRVWHMIGAERLSQLRLDAAAGTAPGDRVAGEEAPGTPAPAQIAAEFTQALRLAHTDLGATSVRAHAILHDDNDVVTVGPGGVLRFDFARVDAIYDQLLGLGLRPVVELSPMPAALARDPTQTVFTYRGIISPPADWGSWRSLVTALATHLVGRYGIDEVARWAFEVWNEPNLAVFWSGTRDEYLRLYDESARAIKAVDGRLRVGGPATAAAGWIEPFFTHAAEAKVPLDFVTTHTYGNLPLDLRPALARHGLRGTAIWWTEWGIAATHFGPANDSAIGAPFVLSGFRSAQGRLDALAYWVVSDHFEELGRPQRLFHNGFGLLTVGNLRKPRYWAAHLAAHLGDCVLATTLEGDGAETLVQAWATRHADGGIDVLAWNGTINAALLAGDQRLDRQVRLSISGLGRETYQAALARVDERHSNIIAQCPATVAWPDAEMWARLRASDQLHEEELPNVTPEHGSAQFTFGLPMPGVVRIRLSARRKAASHKSSPIELTRPLAAAAG